MMNLVGTAIGQKVASSTKTLLALALVLATLLAASVPALAQTEPKTEPRAGQEEVQQQEEAGPQPEQKEGRQPGADAEPKADPKVGPETEEPKTEDAQPGEVSATGRIGRLADYPGATHGINDEATGAFHALRSDTVDLDAYADSGQRVTVYGTQRQTLVAEQNPVLDVVRVVPADVEDPGGDEDDEATLSFELTVDGDPPAGADFYGNVVTGEGGPGLFVPLADPDGDRVYTGSTTVDRFGPGPRPVPPGVEPISLPVRIVQDYSEVVKDFGTVKLDGDKTFSASVSFPVDDCPIISPTPEQCGDGGSGGGSGSGGSGSGSGGSSDGGSSGDNGGSGAVGSVESNGGGVPVGIVNGLRGVLPSTGGGTVLWVLGAGALLAGGGLLIRRLAR